MLCIQTLSGHGEIIISGSGLAVYNVALSHGFVCLCVTTVVVN